MKKKIIGIAMIAAIALGAGWNMMQSENEVSLSDLALSNVEALAQNESGSYVTACKGDEGSFGSLKRTKGPNNKCIFKNIYNATVDGQCML